MKITASLLAALVLAAVASNVSGAPAEHAPLSASRSVSTTVGGNAAELHAQQVSAWWTRFAALVSVAGVAISGGGLVLILRQLRHSEDANRQAAAGAKAAIAAAEAATATSRAWMQVSAETQSRMQFVGERGYVLQIPIEWKNIGQTPAIAVWDHVQLVSASLGVEEQLSGMSRADDTVGRTAFPNDLDRKTWIIDLPLTPNSPLSDWSVLVAVFYRLPGDDRQRRTVQRYQIGKGARLGVTPEIYQAHIHLSADRWIEPT